MVQARKSYHAFLSYSLVDRDVALRLRELLGSVGLDVFDPVGVDGRGDSIFDEIWSALALCESVIVIVPKDGSISSNSAAELGAASAWHRQVFIVYQGKQPNNLSGFLTRFPQYPLSNVEDIAMAVKQGLDPLSDKDLDILKKVYHEFGVPTDRLITDPLYIDDLANRFRTRSKSQVAGERLFYELLRLRKRGELPRIGERGKSAGRKKISRSA